MVSYAAPNRPPELFSTVRYRVTRASGENPAERMGVPFPPPPTILLVSRCFYRRVARRSHSPRCREHQLENSTVGVRHLACYCAVDIPPTFDVFYGAMS